MADPESVAESAGLEAEAVKALAGQLAAAREQLQAQRLLRESNLEPQRPSEDDLKQLDSSVKRNTTLTKKLKQLSEESKHSLIEEIKKTNQTKYVSEAVQSIADAPLRASDVPAAVAVCSLLHQRYADFGAEAAPALAKAFGRSGAGADGADGPKRRRALLRLLGELLAAGVYSGAGHLMQVLKELALPDYKRDRESATNSLTLLGTFAKWAREQLTGLQPQALLAAEAAVPQQLTGEAVAGLPAEVAAALDTLRAEQAALQDEVAKRFVLPEAEHAVLSKVFERAWEAAAAALQEDHRRLAAQEVENSSIVNTRGDLPPDVAAEYEARRKAYEVLHRAVSALADGLGKELPELQEDAFTRLTVADAQSSKDAPTPEAPTGPEPVFEDQESRAFYESLPDVRGLVPSVLLSDGKEEPPQAAAKEAAGEGEGETAAADGGSAGAGADGGSESAQAPGDHSADGTAAPATATSTAAPATPAGSRTAGLNPAAESGGSGGGSPDGDGVAAAASAADGGADGGDGGAGSANQAAMELILSRLSSCVSRDLADDLAVNYCFVNSKPNRRRLARALCDVPRAALQLVPFYARVVAVLAQVFPDVPAAVISFLEAEFQYLVRRKDPTGSSLEQRVRNARYLAELAKFRLLQPGAFFSNLKQLLDDFTGINIESACALVETAGRFMYRCPETKIRMENMMEVMMRLKAARNLDPRYLALIDSAYFAVKPPGRAALRRRVRPPLHEYIRHMVFVRLTDATIPEVLKKLLKLPWEQCEKYVMKCLLKVVRGRFSNIQLVSCLAAGLAQYHESIGVALVDAVLEDVRTGLESPGTGTYQKRMADVKLLGELYNYMLCNSTPVFESLYLLVTHGHECAEAAERLDPPDDFFRIRLVCALLDTCGQYFNEGAARARLDRFLTFFQAYILSKHQLPLDVEFDLQDVLHGLRPHLRRFSTYQEALAAVQAIIAREIEQYGGVLGTIGEEEEDGEDERRGGGGGGGSDTEGGSGGRGEVRSLDDMSGRSSDVEGDHFDDDFEREWQQLMGETQRQLGGLSVQPAASQLAVSQQDYDGDGGADGAGGRGGGMVSFKMLVKRGGKDDRSRELQVPVTSAVALAVRAAEEEEAREREEMKRLVLAASRQQQEEVFGGGRPAGGVGRSSGSGTTAAGGAGGAGGAGAGSGQRSTAGNTMAAIDFFFGPQPGSGKPRGGRRRGEGG